MKESLEQITKYEIGAKNKGEENNRSTQKSLRMGVMAFTTLIALTSFAYDGENKNVTDNQQKSLQSVVTDTLANDSLNVARGECTRLWNYWLNTGKRGFTISNLCGGYKLHLGWAEKREGETFFANMSLEDSKGNITRADGTYSMGATAAGITRQYLRVDCYCGN